ncbi:hypothetical protein HOC35_05390 [Candidatus Woesearchaeota archaeon]|jgi:hypothetical protein|nr:hypothetical protein [Candidatus Woesearchaeota archaeon]
MTKTNINRQIWNIISRDIAVQKCIVAGIVNNRALAKYLIKEYNLSFSLDAVLSAVRRYSVEEEFEEYAKEVDEALSKMMVMTKNNIASIKLKVEAFTNIANDYLTKLILKHNFRMIKSKEVIKLFVNQKDLDKKLKAFDPNYIIGDIHNLCEVRIILEEEATYVRGILSRITSELTLHNVNIHDIIVGIPEILIYVEEKDLVLAQKCLMDFRKK